MHRIRTVAENRIVKKNKQERLSPAHDLNLNLFVRLFTAVNMCYI